MSFDFEQFSSDYKERTAKRMLDFEETLVKAQADVEKAADDARSFAAAQAAQAAREQAGRAAWRNNSAPDPHSGGSGQVKSVLRRT